MGCGCTADVRTVAEAASDRTDPYELLGVARDAPVEEIILAYRLVVRTMLAHPDLVGDDWNLALADQAYRTLTHADLRADCDAWLADREGRARRSRPPAAYLAADGVNGAASLAPLAADRAPALRTETLPAKAGTKVLPVREETDRPDPAAPPTNEERRALLRLRREGSIRWLRAVRDPVAARCR